ncbi:acyl-CoA dehydrogenase family protein [Ochrobactrum teleogrylli]|uniref:Acyl-CoA dehydrogenase n=1 Tax=Ochrobactrum teleogrylli TaxID=2479765 RepID=A0ABY2Y4Q7_9HYPH|nr:acyl-CoA dehydrogenase family protein [[Ochrobactrum] teleogrylli]TNV16339.1 acyl-CoA dehydrogenase [[Ochrobactrum] teleogrylli]
MTHDCLLTDEQRMIRDSARSFAREKLAPTAAMRDREHHYFPRTEMQELGELGFLGMLVSEEWGGVATDHLSYVLALEEIAAADGSIGAMMALHNGLISTPLRVHGSDRQKELYLRPLAEGRFNGAFGLTEPEAGSNAFAIRTKAVRVDGGFRLTGAKQFMSNGKSADIAIIFAATESDDPRRRITAFLVSPTAPGYVCVRIEDKLGLAASETCQVQLDDVFVADDHVLGEVGGGYALAMSTLELGRLGIAAQSLGLARAAFDHAHAYALERQTFGKAIIEHQAVGFRLAEMHTQIEVARSYLHYVARLRDAGQPCKTEAAMAKLFASEIAEKVASEAIQVHGGYGYLKDFAVERIYRDARICRIYEGTSDIQKLIIAGSLAKKGKAV